MVELRLGKPSGGAGSLEGATIMDKTTVELLARRAGLEKALAQFPEDVAAAAKQASDAVAKMKVPSDPHAEPWPPMRVGTGS